MIPRLLPVAGRGGIFLTPFVVIVLCLFRWSLQPETAALYAALTLLPIGFLLGYGGDRLSFRSLVASFVKTGKAGLELLMIGGAAGAIIGVLNISALGFALTSELVGIAGGSLFILLILAAIVCIVLGMGMPTLGVYILLATLVAPAIIELGVPDLSAHLFVMYFGMMSMITPPVAIAAFAAATLAGAPMMKTGWQAVKYGWSAYLIPFVFIMSPALIMQGGALEVGAQFHDRPVRRPAGLGRGYGLPVHAHPARVPNRPRRSRARADRAGLRLRRGAVAQSRRRGHRRGPYRRRCGQAPGARNASRHCRRIGWPIPPPTGNARTS